MKIAIPLTATDEFSPHYGGSSKFAVIDVDPEERTVRMAEHGVKVLAGVPSVSPDELIAAWLAGRLTPGANACNGSGHGDHHGDGHDHHGGDCDCGH